MKTLGLFFKARAAERQSGGMRRTPNAAAKFVRTLTSEPLGVNQAQPTGDSRLGLGASLRFGVWSLKFQPLVRHSLLAFLVCISSVAACRAAAPGDSSVLDTWLASQAKVKTWAADFVQTRTFKTLSQPLKESGHVWFKAPDRFHWELGHPPKTIAIRAPNEMLLFYPRLKRVERFPLTEAAGPWREAMGLLEAGFPRSREQMESRFKILSQKATDHAYELTMEPRSPAARKMMPKIGITFDTQTQNLLSTSIQFADGSSMRNDFSNPQLNPEVDEKMFSPEIPAGYKVVEPLKNAK